MSHEGATAATNRAMDAARATGATVALITVSEHSPGAARVDIVLATEELDQSWCHTVGYLSPLLAAVRSRRPFDESRSGAARSRGSSQRASSARRRRRPAARSIAASRRIIVIASGADRPAGRELTLKIEEAAWVPTASRNLETFLHGHLPATGDSTGLVLILAERAAGDERAARARQALAAAREVRIRSAAILGPGAAAELDGSLTPAGRILVPEDASIPAPVAALLATATPLQLFTERLARACGTNPDPIRRDDPRYLAAADAAEG